MELKRPINLICIFFFHFVANVKHTPAEKEEEENILFLVNNAAGRKFENLWNVCHFERNKKEEEKNERTKRPHNGGIRL